MAQRYNDPRPELPADLRRAIEVESGHACAVARCGEHTYLEIHHINENREDNRLENLVLLCDKHHKMAHAGVIDRKALRQYKEELKRAHYAALLERLTRLEELLAAQPKDREDSSVDKETVSDAPVDDGLPILTFASRAELSARTLEQLALARFEAERSVSLRRGATLAKGGSQLHLDALYQSSDGGSDLLVEVRWLRKLYLDAPVWVRQVVTATEAYELFTGRTATGVLIFVAPNKHWANIAGLTQTAAELSRQSRVPQVIVYNYDDLGFKPAALSADGFDEMLSGAKPGKPKEGR